MYKENQYSTSTKKTKCYLFSVIMPENANYLVEAGASEHMKKVCDHLLGLFLPSMKPIMNPVLKLIHLVLQLVGLPLHEGQVQLLSEKN